jgi:hypothetical protein
MTDDIRAARARRAAEAHERLCKRIEDREDKGDMNGITRLRVDRYALLHDRMRAELEARR